MVGLKRRLLTAEHSSRQLARTHQQLQTDFLALQTAHDLLLKLLIGLARQRQQSPIMENVRGLLRLRRGLVVSKAYLGEDTTRWHIETEDADSGTAVEIKAVEGT